MEGMSAVCESILNEKDVVILPVPVYAGSADMVRLKYNMILYFSRQGRLNKGSLD